MAEILIYGVIGETFFGDGVTAKAVADQLAGVSDSELRVRINSPGGSVWDGVAIYNLLESHPARVTVDIDGAALSAASLIAMAGDTIRMAENAMLMIHKPMTMTFGNEDDHEQTIALLRKIEGNIIQTYRHRLQQDPEAIAALLKAETWYDASEAQAAGLVDEVTGKGAGAAEAKNRFRRLANELKKPEDAQQALAAYRSIEVAQRKLALTKTKVAV